MKKRTRAILFVLLALVALGLWFVLHRPSNSLAILENSYGARLKVIKREALSPMIEIRLFGKRFRYPEPALPINPDRFPAIAGIIDGRLLRDSEFGIYHSPEWTIDGIRYESYFSSVSDNDKLIPAPFVFGDADKHAFVDPPGAKPFTLNLPSNGLDVPTIEPIARKVGPYSVHFTPKPVVSPVFPPIYEVTVTGGKHGERFAITPYYWHQDGSGHDFDMADQELLCGEEPAEFRMMRWGKKTMFEFGLARLKETRFNATVLSLFDGKFARVRVFDDKGVCIFDVEDNGRRLRDMSEGRSRFSNVLYKGHDVILSGKRLTSVGSLPGMSHEPQTDTYILESILDLWGNSKHKRSVLMTGINHEEAVQASVHFELPNPKLFQLGFEAVDRP